jgi:hypothetical protein
MRQVSDAVPAALAANTARRAAGDGPPVLFDDDRRVPCCRVSHR